MMESNAIINILTKQKQDQKIKSYIPNLKALQAPLIEN